MAVPLSLVLIAHVEDMICWNCFIAEEIKPVFGVPLIVAVERSPCHDGIQLPIVVRECIDYVEEFGMSRWCHCL